MEKNITLSIIITAHHEGRLVEKTLESLLAAANKLKSVRYDFWVNIDKGDSETVNFFKKWAKKIDLNICYTDFGDPGLARNSIAQKVKGDYVAFIDADDMITANWFEKAIDRINMEQGDVLVHPEAELRFNKEKALALSIRKDAEKDKWLNTLTLFGDNRWCSIVVGKRKIFLEHPYSATCCGFGYEDYYFNCITADDGIRHVVARGTTAFLLQKEKSVTSATHARGDLLPYIDAFSFKRLKTMAKRFGLPKLPKELRFTKVPAYVRAGAKEISFLEPKIVEKLNKIGKYDVSKDGTDEDFLIGITFCEMIKGKKIKSLFNKSGIVFVANLVEWQEYRKKYGKNILIVILDDADNIVEDKNTLNFYKYFGWMYPIAQNLALSRLIVQLRPKYLILNNIKIVCEWGSNHREFIDSNDIKIEEGVI